MSTNNGFKNCIMFTSLDSRNLSALENVILKKIPKMFMPTKVMDYTGHKISLELFS